MEYRPLRIVRFSGAALTGGIENHIIEGETLSNAIQAPLDDAKLKSQKRFHLV